jgi:hypothetical protein
VNVVIEQTGGGLQLNWTMNPQMNLDRTITGSETITYMHACMHVVALTIFPRPPELLSPDVLV